MKYLQKIIFSICLAGVVLCSLTSCGRYSDPSPVENSHYPHNYPHR